MDYKEKLGEAQKLIEQAKAIVNDPKATPEDKAKVEPMLKDAQALKAEALQLKESETVKIQGRNEGRTAAPLEQKAASLERGASFKPFT
jgi:hypothetical protein